MNEWKIAAVAALALFANCGLASDFDGSKRLICANTEASDCGPGQSCVRARADEVGAPTFIRIDFAQKSIVGPKRTSPIVTQEKSGNQVLLQGTELGYAWSLALDTMTGRMSATLVDRDGAIVLFGTCTPL